MTVQGLLRALRLQWLLLITAAVIGGFLGLSTRWWLPQQYEARAELFVTVQGAGTSGSDLFQASSFAQQRVASYVRVGESLDTLQRVIIANQLAMQPHELSDKLMIENALDTFVLTIRVRDTSAELAARLANAVGNELIASVERLEGRRGTAGPSVRITMLSEARTPNSPQFPRVQLNTAAGIILALGAAMVLAAFKEARCPRIRSRHDLDRIIPSPTTTFVTSIPKDQLGDSQTAHVGTDLTRIPSMELLYASLVRRWPESSRVIAVAQPLPNSGVGTISASLARAAIDRGAYTCLVDLNNVRSKSPSAQDAAKTECDDLGNLPAGYSLSTEPPLDRLAVTASSLSDPLPPKDLEAVVDFCRERYEVTVIETPAAAVNTAAGDIAFRADDVVIVLSVDEIPVDDARNYLLQLERVGVRVSAAVLIGADQRRHVIEAGR